MKAHVMVAFIGYALWVTLKHLLQEKRMVVSAEQHTNPDLSPARALALLSTLHSADIVLPTTNGREFRLRRITEPDTEQKSCSTCSDSSCPNACNLIRNVVQTRRQPELIPKGFATF